MQAFYLALNHDGILTERCSISILLDLFFGTEFLGLNPCTVVDEIKSLEGLRISQTREEKRFKKRPLRGLWHKHYMNGDFDSLHKNVSHELEKNGIPFFEEKIREAQVTGEERFATREDVPKIINDVLTNNLRRRRNEGRMTGEWIVYAQHEGQNFYLCLAKQKDNDRDKNIREKLERICMREFPFLNNVFQEPQPKGNS